MVAIVSALEIYPDRQRDWHELWRQVQAEHSAAQGFRAARLFHDVDQPERYVILEEWEDRHDFNRFARQAGVPWLLEEWELGPPPPLGLMVVQEEA